MGKQRRKFEIGFNNDLVIEVESGLLTVSAVSREYQISGSVVDRWRDQGRQGATGGIALGTKKNLEREDTVNSNASRAVLWRTCS